MQEKIIGVLGGMGPEATCVLFQRLIHFTKAQHDRDHIRIIIDSNPKIPDRTSAILHNTISPLSEMVNTALNLQNAGAHFIVMPCITAHYFHRDIQNKVSIPIINGLAIVKEHIDNVYTGVEKIGVIATSGTLRTNLFQNLLSNKDIILPTVEDQENRVMDIIYGREGIKAGNRSNSLKDRLLDVVSSLKLSGAQVIIAGCTEISILLEQRDLDIPLIDPLTLMAKKSIAVAQNHPQSF